MEDYCKEGEASVSYHGEPSFDVDTDPLKFTTAQSIAAKVIDFVVKLESHDDFPDIDGVTTH